MIEFWLNVCEEWMSVFWVYKQISVLLILMQCTWIKSCLSSFMCYYALQVAFNRRHGKNVLYVVYYFNFIFPLFMLGIVHIVVFVVALCRLAGWYEYSRRTCCLCLWGWRIRYEFVTDASLHGVTTHMTVFWTSQLLVRSRSCDWVVAR